MAPGAPGGHDVIPSGLVYRRLILQPRRTFREGPHPVGELQDQQPIILAGGPQARRRDIEVDLRRTMIRSAGRGRLVVFVTLWSRYAVIDNASTAVTPAIARSAPQ
jgi:hypothetical protein